MRDEKKKLKIGGRFSTNERKTRGLKNLNLITLPKKLWGLEKKIEDNVVDFLTMRGRHVGEREI